LLEFGATRNALSLFIYFEKNPSSDIKERERGRERHGTVVRG